MTGPEVAPPLPLLRATIRAQRLRRHCRPADHCRSGTATPSTQHPAPCTQHPSLAQSLAQTSCSQSVPFKWLPPACPAYCIDPSNVSSSVSVHAWHPLAPFCSISHLLVRLPALSSPLPPLVIIQPASLTDPERLLLLTTTYSLRGLDGPTFNNQAYPYRQEIGCIARVAAALLSQAVLP